MEENEKTVYEMVGGDETFQRLVDVFYNKIEADEELRSVFPDDLEQGKRWQFLFLMQLFGGPSQYNDERGHPRLRRRHMPFAINERSANLWLKFMLESIDEVEIAEPARSTLIQYFERAAPHMVNVYSMDDGHE